MESRVEATPTRVPIADNQDVKIDPGDPYPGPYRGSRYSIVESRRHNKTVLQWKYEDLVVMVDPPDGLVSQLRDFGKSEGHAKGSIRITAAGEVLTKIHSDNYLHSEQAPVSSGWIPVYVGKLQGELGFDINIDPAPPQQEADIWSGFPFNHGERWAVSVNDNLIWKWQDYRFESAFDHQELISTYQQFRTTAGRLYINEFGHIYVNVPPDGVPVTKQEEITKIYSDWQQRVAQEDDTAAQQLVSRRLKVTGDGDPEEGHLPFYIGHLEDFDDGLIPRPVVTDETYFVKAARGEEVIV